MFVNFCFRRIVFCKRSKQIINNKYMNCQDVSYVVYQFNFSFFTQEMSKTWSKIPMWWRSCTEIRVASAIGCCSILNFRPHVTTNHRLIRLSVRLRHHYGIFRVETQTSFEERKNLRLLLWAFTYQFHLLGSVLSQDHFCLLESFHHCKNSNANELSTFVSYIKEWPKI